MFCSKHVFVITGLLLFIHECSFASASDAVDDEEGGTGPFSGDEEGGSPYGGEEEDDMDDMHGEGGGGGGGGAGKAAPRGAISLDNYTFDKWISLAGYKFFVKFEGPYALGYLKNEWERLAPMAQNVSQFFIAEVGVGFGEWERNEKLAKRYNLLDQEHLPAMLFFNGPEDWTTYTGPNVTEAMTSWLRRKGVKMPSAGTIPDLDDEVFSSIKGGLTDARVEAMQILVDGKFADEKKAAWYPKIMRKMREKGTAYADAEGGRLEKLLTGSMAEEKRSDLTEKLLILGVFQEAIGKGKDEL